MPITGKSLVLSAAFLAGIVIAANADPPYRGGAGSLQPPGPQTATLPPADPARAPASATQQFGPLSPAPQQSSFGHDGSYAGSMTQMPSGLDVYHSVACVYRRPVSMKIERGNVTIWFSNWGGQTLHYRGKLDPSGKVDAWHTNGDGSRALLTGEIGDTGFTGHVARGHCTYALTMQAEVAASSPVH